MKIVDLCHFIRKIMEDLFKTIEKPAEGLYKDKGSRFIALAFPVENEEEIKEIVAGIKEKYYDARHHCYAWCLGVAKTNFRTDSVP